MDSDKIKDFVLYNFEKAIVVAVIGVSGFLIYSGSQKPDITKKHDPDQLVTRANEVKRQVDDDHTETVMKERRETFDIDIASKQQEFLQPIQFPAYAANTLDSTKSITEKVRRKDPELYKPVGVQATGVIASLAWRSSDGVYPLTDLEPADELEKVEQQTRRRPPRRRRGNAMDMEMGGMDMEMGGMDMDMDMMMEMMGGMDSAPTAGDTASGPVRKLDPEAGNGFTPTPTKNLKNGEEQPPVPGVGWFIAGTAAIPHKDLIKSYQEALAYAASYEPVRRDLPLYIGYQIQRADVTNKSVDQLTDADWVVRDGNTETTIDAGVYWSGFAPEIVPMDYFVPGVTMWIPPVLLDPYTDFAVNPLVPLKTQREMEIVQAELEAEQNKESGTIDPGSFEIDIKGGQSRTFGGGDMMDMDYMQGMDDMMGMDMDMGMGMGMGMGGSAGMTGKPAEENPVDYKLLRFYDFAYIVGASKQDPQAPRPGRKYVYRVRFAVNDPNFPQDPMLQPQGKVLDSDAYERFIALTADAKKNGKRNSKRWSEWSEISDPVSLPSFDRSYVGPVKADKVRRINAGSRRIVVEQEPPTAEVVTSSFDYRLGVFVPTLMTATEGTVLSKKVETADVVDPITLEVKKVTDTTIKSNSTVIDVEGGVPLEIVEDELMTEPGMFLMIDGDGKLIVKDSVEQQKLYRDRSFAKERGL